MHKAALTWPANALPPQVIHAIRATREKHHNFSGKNGSLVIPGQCWRVSIQTIRMRFRSLRAGYRVEGLITSLSRPRFVDPTQGSRDLPAFPFSERNPPIPTQGPSPCRAVSTSSQMRVLGLPLMCCLASFLSRWHTRPCCSKREPQYVDGVP